MKNKTIDQLAKILWEYNNINQPVSKSDIILVLCSNDTRVAQYGAELFIKNLAPIMIFSGGQGVLTKDIFNKPEAEVFADEAIKLGVPKYKILLETKSTNTGENIDFTKELISRQNIKSDSIILVQKPYMLRRSFATFKKRWPDQQFTVTGPKISFEDYPNETISKDLLINIMVGDTQRIKLYAEKGFQIPQDMPDMVWEAYEELVKRGFVSHLIS